MEKKKKTRKTELEPERNLILVSRLPTTPCGHIRGRSAVSRKSKIPFRENTTGITLYSVVRSPIFFYFKFCIRNIFFTHISRRNRFQILLRNKKRHEKHEMLPPRLESGNSQINGNFFSQFQIKNLKLELFRISFSTQTLKVSS